MLRSHQIFLLPVLMAHQFGESFHRDLWILQFALKDNRSKRIFSFVEVKCTFD